MTPKEKQAFEKGKFEGVRIQHAAHEKIRNDALEEAAIVAEYGAEWEDCPCSDRIRTLKRTAK